MSHCESCDDAVLMLRVFRFDDIEQEETRVSHQTAEASSSTTRETSGKFA